MENLTSDDLASLGRNVQAPFLVTIVPCESTELGRVPDAAAESVELKIDRILRLLPGKRLVGISSWNGKPVIAKIFFQKGSWKRHINREQQGNKSIHDAGIPSPRTLQGALIRDGQGAVLVNEYLEGAINLGDLLVKGDPALEQVLEKALELIARCHEQGIWQDDIHLDNFILQQDTVYLLDGADIKVEHPGRPLSYQARIQNLALFFAQFPASDDSLLQRRFACFDQQVPASGQGINYPDLLAQVHKARDKRLDAYTRKLGRSSTAHFVRHQQDRFVVGDREVVTDEFDSFIDNPDGFIDQGEILKAGNTSTVAVVTINHQRYLLKRYNIKSFWHGVTRVFRPSRAYNSWRYALILRLLGVNTPRPLLMLERRFCWWFRRQAYFLCELLEGDTVTRVVESGREDVTLMSKLFDDFKQLFIVFRDSRISHGDFKATNFIYTDNKLYVLDLDAMTRHKSDKSFSRYFHKDLSRFVKNWLGDANYKVIAGKAGLLTSEFIN